jgi:hypothetical protein
MDIIISMVSYGVHVMGEKINEKKIKEKIDEKRRAEQFK